MFIKSPSLVMSTIWKLLQNTISRKVSLSTIAVATWRQISTKETEKLEPTPPRETTSEMSMAERAKKAISIIDHYWGSGRPVPEEHIVVLKQVIDRASAQGDVGAIYWIWLCNWQPDQTQMRN